MWRAFREILWKIKFADYYKLRIIEKIALFLGLETQVRIRHISM